MSVNWHTTWAIAVINLHFFLSQIHGKYKINPKSKWQKGENFCCKYSSQFFHIQRTLRNQFKNSLRFPYKMGKETKR